MSACQAEDRGFESRRFRLQTLLGPAKELSPFEASLQDGEANWLSPFSRQRALAAARVCSFQARRGAGG